jgi:putative hydrolase of the HAD superfamily
MSQSPIEVAVFDVVGTLIYPDPSVATAYETVARRFGSNLNNAEIEARFKRAFQDEEVTARGEDLRTSESIERERWRRIVARVLSDVRDPNGCFLELFAHFALSDSWRLFSDVPGTLAALRSNGIRLGVASNFDRRLIEILRGFELMSQFEFVIVCSEVGFRKPHRGFFDAIAKSAAADPSSILYVGDDPEHDVAAARAAGMHGLLVERATDNGRGPIRSLRELVFSVV